MKPKMLYASPFWPQKSGISEYSEVLLKYLAEVYDITLLINQAELDNKLLENSFTIKHYKKDEKYNGYDVILYNIGNQPDFHGYMYDCIAKNPGYVILHDFILYYLTVGYYQPTGEILQKIYEMEGSAGISLIKDRYFETHEQNFLEYKTLADKLPLNKELLSNSKGIFTHSEYTRNMIENMNLNIPVNKIDFIDMSESIPKEKDGNILKEQYRIPKDAFIITSMGFISSTKQNDLICQAVNLYNEKNKEPIYYIMAGEGTFADQYLSKYIIKTGFLPKYEYWSIIKCSDLIMNLRYPTNGETSATLIECMGIGKLCVVTDVGWFSELPDDTIIKISYDISEYDLKDKICKIINSDHQIVTQNAKHFVNKTCSGKHIAKQIDSFFI